jgi:hypothetical protein
VSFKPKIKTPGGSARAGSGSSYKGGGGGGIGGEGGKEGEGGRTVGAQERRKEKRSPEKRSKPQGLYRFVLIIKRSVRQ